MKRAGWLLLLLSGMVWTACSSDDDELVENSNDRKLRQLTIAEVPVTKDTPASKRVQLTDNSSSLDALWTKEDRATYFNVSSFSSVTVDYGKLTAASSTATSMFQGAVNCITGDKVALLYPAKDPVLSGPDRGKFTISLNGQKGTLEDIADNFHYVYGVAEVTSVTEQTATATIDNMQSLLCFTDGLYPDSYAHTKGLCQFTCSRISRTRHLGENGSFRQSRQRNFQWCLCRPLPL